MNRANKVAALQAIADGRADATDLQAPACIVAFQSANADGVAGWKINGQWFTDAAFREMQAAHRAACTRRQAIGQPVGYCIRVVYEKQPMP